MNGITPSWDGITWSPGGVRYRAPQSAKEIDILIEQNLKEEKGHKKFSY